MYYEQQLVRLLEALVQQGKITIVSGLTIDVTEFKFWRRVDDLITQVSAPALASVVLTDSTTNYVYVVESTATTTVSLAPPPVGTFPLAEITTAGGAITGIVDRRSFFGLPWDLAKLILTAKGQLVAHDGASEVPFPVGADGTVLTADSASPTGFTWDPCPPPGPHATEHISTGTDPIPVVSGGATGLLPPITGLTTDYFNGGGLWGPIPIVSIPAPGLAPARDGVADNTLGGDGVWRTYRTVDWWRFSNPTGALSASIGVNPHQNILWQTTEASSGAAGVTVDATGRILLDRPVGAGAVFTYEITWHTTKLNFGQAFHELHADDDVTVLARSGDVASNTVNTDHAFEMTYMVDVDDAGTALLPNVYEVWFNGNVGLVPDGTRNKLHVKRYRFHV